MVFYVLLTLFVVWQPLPGFCLEPEEILVVANRRMEGSVDLAHYYMDLRLVPKSNILSLSLSLDETMSRKEYDHILKKEVLNSLNRLRSKNRIEAIVLVYGVPLKVAPPRLNVDDLASIGQLITHKEVHGHQQAWGIDDLRNTNMRAAVDSELALVRAGL